MKNKNTKFNKKIINRCKTLKLSTIKEEKDDFEDFFILRRSQDIIKKTKKLAKKNKYFGLVSKDVFKDEFNKKANYLQDARLKRKHKFDDDARLKEEKQINDDYIIALRLQEELNKEYKQSIRK